MPGVRRLPTHVDLESSGYPFPPNRMEGAAPVSWSTSSQRRLRGGGKAGLVCLFVAIALSQGLRATAQHIIQDIEEEEEPEPRVFVLPYALYSEAFDFAFGIAGGTSGYLQRQSSLFGTVLGSASSSYALFLLAKDLQIPPSKRLFLDLGLSVAKYKALRAYVDGNPNFPDGRAGTNDSHQDDYLEKRGRGYWTDFRLQYLFPTGHGRDQIVHTFRTENGLLSANPAAGGAWNPLKSGRTYAEVRPFYRSEELKFDTGDESLTTSGIEFALEYDNRDFSVNPSKGSRQRVAVTRDWGWLGSTDSWTVIEVDLSKYFSLGETRHFRQQVIALNFWTADTPTWEETGGGENLTISHRPPYYEGATLGGFYRMRAFPSYRFNDKSAIYYCAEYRVIPRWNPLAELGWLRFLETDWWQLVGFMEIGRVASTWSLDELHSDMKWDAGFGIRAMMRKTVVRADIAFSEEGTALQAMVGHPF